MTGSTFTRNPETAEREMDGAAFLVGPGNDGLFHLNPTGTAVWRLLAEPIDVDDAVSVMTEAFPEIAVEQIRGDVEALIGRLHQRGLIVPSG